MAATFLHRRARWALPAGTAVAIAAAVAAPHAFAAGTPHLAPLSAAELVAHVEQARPQPLSGELAETAAFGLPSVPGLTSGAGASPQNLLSGTNTMQLWVGGPTEQRLALLADGSEYDVYRDGDALWTWNSTKQTATHVTLPAHHGSAAAGRDAGAPALTPQQLAAKFLAAVGRTATVRVADPVYVAHRPAYVLTLAPKDTASTLIGSVQIAVDARTWLPDQVQIYDQRGALAFSLGFTRLHPGAQPRGLFAFTPPARATVRRASAPTAPSRPADRAPHVAPRVLGSGWDTVIELPAGTVDTTALTGRAAGYLAKLPTVDGNRLLATSLVTVLLRPDGSVLAGPVPPGELETLAATSP